MSSSRSEPERWASTSPRPATGSRCGRWRLGISLAPSSAVPLPLIPQPFPLGHCGLCSGVDVDGVWWDPVGLIAFDHGDAINATDGTFAPVGPDRATFTSTGGFVVQLVRRDGHKFLPFCL